MKLYLIHLGYYDKNSDGFYEQHTNILIVSENVHNAKNKIKNHNDFLERKMHIDGIKEIEIVDGYQISLNKTSDKQKITTYNHNQVRFLKSK